MCDLFVDQTFVIVMFGLWKSLLVWSKLVVDLVVQLLVSSIRNALVYYILMAIAIAIATTPPLAPPKGFKFCRFLSRLDPNVASTNESPPPLSSYIIIPSCLESIVQPPTPIGESGANK